MKPTCRKIFLKVSIINIAILFILGLLISSNLKAQWVWEPVGYSNWSGQSYTGGGGPYWNFGNNPNPAPFFGTAYTGGGGPYWIHGDNPNPGPLFGTAYTGGGGPYWIHGDNPNPGPFFGTAYINGGFLGVGDLPPIIHY